MSHRKFIRDVGTIGLTNLAFALRGIILLPVITKLLDEESYGIWSQIIITVSIASFLITLGLPYALVRFLAGEENITKIREGISSATVFTVALAGTFFIIASLVSDGLASILSFPRNILLTTALIISVDCLNLLFLNFFRARQYIGTYSSFAIIQGVGEIVLTVVFIKIGYGLSGAILALLFSRMVTILFLGSIIFQKFPPHSFNFSTIKKYLSFSLPTIPANFSSWIIHSADRYVIAFFAGAASVGYYSAAYTLGGIIAFFEAPLSFILPSRLSALYDKGDIESVKQYLSKSLKYLLMIMIPAVFGLSILANQFLMVLATPQIAQKGSALVPFLALSMLFYGLYGSFVQVLVLEKKMHIAGYIWTILAFIHIVSNFILIRLFGTVGAAVITLVTYSLVLISTYHFCFKYLTFPIDWKFIIKSVIASIIMSAFIIAIHPSASIVSIIIAVISGAALYLISLLALRAFEEKELQILKKLIRLGK